jgi:hypothetical protein
MHIMLKQNTKLTEQIDKLLRETEGSTKVI